MTNLKLCVLSFTIKRHIFKQRLNLTPKNMTILQYTSVLGFFYWNIKRNSLLPKTMFFLRIETLRFEFHKLVSGFLVLRTDESFPLRCLTHNTHFNCFLCALCTNYQILHIKECTIYFQTAFRYVRIPANYNVS